VEVLKALRGRLSDSQSNLKPLAAQAIAEVMLSLDEAVRIHTHTHTHTHTLLLQHTHTHTHTDRHTHILSPSITNTHTHTPTHPQMAPRFVKFISEPLLTGAADNKKSMRDASLAAIEKIIATDKSLEAMLPALATAIQKYNVGRTELLSALVPFFSSPTFTYEASLLAPPLLEGLQVYIYTHTYIRTYTHTHTSYPRSH
jgi:hypothetical protein